MAIIYPKIENKIVGKGEFIKVPIYIDTQFEEINAVEVKVKFSNNLVFRDYLEGRSIIGIWVEKPHLIQSKDLKHSQAEIMFSGVIPGGISGKDFELVELIFEAKESGEANIEIDNSSIVLLNDGLGTKTKTLALSDSLNITQTKGERKIEIQDIYSPEDFKIYLARDPNLFNGKYFITFQTKDKQSGIAYYEVNEVPISLGQIFALHPDKVLKTSEDGFKKVESPYVLEDQSLRSLVFVKAVDRAGNEKVEFLRPRNLIMIEDLLIFCLSILFFVLLLIKLKKR